MNLEETIQELQTLEKSLQQLIKNNEVAKIKEEAQQIKDSFYLKYNEIVASAKEDFINEGGAAELFDFQLPIQQHFKNTWNSYLEKKRAHQQELDLQLKKNLIKKETIIEQIKQMVDGGEHNYLQFKELLAAWKNIGAVPTAQYPMISGNFHHQVERFYDLIHLNDELRTIDFKHNLEAKLHLIERASKLLAVDDVNFVFTELQELHRIWKDELGPVAKIDRERIWNEFSQITTQIHQKRDAYFIAIKAKEQENLASKLTLIQQIEALLEKQPKNFNDWKNVSDKFNNLKEQFLLIGKTPKESSKKTWESFKAVTANFNHQKNSFFKESKKIQQTHINQRNQLINLAKEHKLSEDLVYATNLFKQIQREWKTLPPVPKKIADVLWAEFHRHCNDFFNRIQHIKEEGTSAQQANFVEKSNLLARLKDEKISKETVGEFLENWVVSGEVVHKNKLIEKEILNVLTAQLNQLNVDPLLLEEAKYVFLKLTDSKKLSNEYVAVKKSIDDTTKELKQLENNSSFITKTSKNQSIFNEINATKEILSNKIIKSKKLLQLIKKYL